MLELMARGGMRIGEVLKLRAKDVDDRKLLITKPKSGREYEVVYIPKKVAERLRDYVRIMKLEQDQAVFPIGYSGARAAVKKAGLIVGIDLNPHDLRRHAATFASTAGHLLLSFDGACQKDIDIIYLGYFPNRAAPRKSFSPPPCKEPRPYLRALPTWTKNPGLSPGFHSPGVPAWKSMAIFARPALSALI